jgi:hypothetical protein
MKIKTWPLLAGAGSLLLSASVSANLREGLVPNPCERTREIEGTAPPHTRKPRVNRMASKRLSRFFGWNVTFNMTKKNQNIRVWLGKLAAGIALIACQAGLHADGGASAGAALRLLPENPRYFEYKGLPMVLFMHKGGVEQMPYPDARARDAVVRASRHGNHYYMPVHHTWVRATFEETHRQLNDDQHWQRVREIARAAHAHDVVLHLFFWSYKFNYAKQDGTGSDMVWPNPADDGGMAVGSQRLTRRDLHELAIKRTLAATWEFPNVVYNFMWEYNVRYRGKDPDGAFHRWWAGRVREEGRRIDPTITHLISVKLGHVPPAHVGADFVVEEDGNGFWYNHPHRIVFEHHVPAVFISSDFVFADNTFSGWENIQHSPRKWANGQVVGYNIRPEDVRAMLAEGFHPAETWVPARDDTLHYYLQARWYMENVGVLKAKPHSSIDLIPGFRASARPALANPEGYSHGRKGRVYAAIYRHPDGLPPAQAEVWVDVDGDGRFNSSNAGGERFGMKPQGDDYRKGVLYTTTAPANCRYVFRFADRNWNPPVNGGLMLGKAGSVSYGHWSAEGEPVE